VQHLWTRPFGPGRLGVVRHLLEGQPHPGLPPGATAEVTGSVTDEASLNVRSDVDLHLTLLDDHALGDLLAPVTVWVMTETGDADGQLLRIVLTDGRRVAPTELGRGEAGPGSAAGTRTHR